VGRFLEGGQSRVGRVSCVTLEGEVARARRRVRLAMVLATPAATGSSASECVGEASRVEAKLLIDSAVVWA
jgi:1-aminocyclopropane-1-carboxylate deaminase/D-cysteine desulfhydrase-like pyridoxal-dependent ACC family enzyme